MGGPSFLCRLSHFRWYKISGRSAWQMLRAMSRVSTWNNICAEDNPLPPGASPSSKMISNCQFTDRPTLTHVLRHFRSLAWNAGGNTPGSFVCASLITEDNSVKPSLEQRRFTENPATENSFGSTGKAQMHGLHCVLLTIGRPEYRYHQALRPPRGRMDCLPEDF